VRNVTTVKAMTTNIEKRNKDIILATAVITTPCLDARNTGKNPHVFSFINTIPADRIM
jgi:hypothetical protein